MDNRCAKCGAVLPEGKTRCPHCASLALKSPLGFARVGMGCIAWLVGSAIIAWLALHGIVFARHFGGLRGSLAAGVLGVLLIVGARCWAKRSLTINQTRDIDAYLAMSFFIFWFLMIQYCIDHGIMQSSFDFLTSQV